MNQKGQALIEFILLLPIIFIIIMGIYDFGNIMYHKYKMESQLDYVIDLYEHDQAVELENYLDKNNLEMVTSSDTAYQLVELKSNVRIITPGLNRILGSPYKIHSSRLIYEG